MKVTTVGIDLAKNVFRVHGCDARGRTVFSKQLTRRQLPGFLANLPRCLVGMEACSSAHYWAREIQKLGHEVRLMTPRFVRPYVKANKNDASDAEGDLRGGAAAGRRCASLRSRARLSRTCKRCTARVINWSRSAPPRPGAASHAPLKEAEYMTATGLSLIGLNQRPCAWGAVHI